MSTRVRAACSCGFTGRYDTQARADYALRRHSCERWTRIREAATAGTAREAKIDRTPQPCLHPVADHQHGTYAAYTLDACRCVPCSRATSVYYEQLNRAKAYGTWEGLVDAGPAREHIAMLREAKLGLKRIAALAGVSASSLGKLVYGTATHGPSERVTGETARKVLAVPVPTVVDLGKSVTVDGTGTRRRLEALIALGWSVKRLCDEHDLDRQALDRALVGAPVQAVTARRVRVMFEAVGDRRPSENDRTERQSAARSRNRAAKRGWVVPAEWDDAGLDDPHAAPPTGGGGRVTLDLDEWAHLVRGGETPARAAERCDVTVSAVEAAIKRGDRADLDRLLRQVRDQAAA